MDGNSGIGADSRFQARDDGHTGIGVTGFTHIDVNVGQLEAQTTTGGVRIASEGPITVGGVTQP